MIPAGGMATSVLKINNQEDFNLMQKRVLSAIKSGEKTIVVSISPGTYSAKENHLVLNNINAPDVELHINGNNAILIPQGQEYKNGDAYNGTFSIDNSWMSGVQDISVWTPARYADGLIEVLDASTKECRLKGADYFPTGTDISNAFILITQWYRSYVYKISKVEGNYIYFMAENLASGYNNMGYNINNDQFFGGLNPRYKLCNLNTGDDVLGIVNDRIKLPNGISFVREGVVNRYLSVNNCVFRSLEISGLVFCGNSNSENKSTITLRDLKSENVCIHNCVFYGIRSNVISLFSSPNVRLENNLFQDCYNYGIRSDNGCRETVVKGNRFVSMGKGMDNTFCVVCRGENFRISNNTFTDFGYGGIGAGVHYKTAKHRKCTGIMENNELCYTKEYIDNKDNYTIMDAGAIYLWTKNDGIIIQHNFIHDIDGMKTNQGIFCDDGASDFTIVGNVILRIANSNCIGSRRYEKAEEKNTSGTGILYSNVNNVIENNLVDGRIRFEGNERQDNGCVFGNNYVLVKTRSALPAHKIENVRKEGDVINLTVTGLVNGHIGVSRSSYKKLSKSDEWNNLKEYVVRK